MPIRLNNTAEGGPLGTAITSGTSSLTGATSGAAFQVSRGANSTIVFTDQAAHGSRAYDLTIAAGEAAYLQWDTGDPSATIAQRAYFAFDGPLAATTQEVMSIRPLSGQIVSICVTPTGMLRALSSTGSTLATGTVAMQAGTYYRLEAIATADTDGDTTAEGSVTAAYYVGDSTTAQDTITVTGTTGTGTTLGQVVRFGRSGANTNAWHYRLDDLAAQTGATGFIGPYTAAVATSTANLTAEAGTLVLLTGNSAEAGTWAQTAGTPTVTLGGDPVNATFDAPVLLTDTALTFTRGGVTTNVAVLKAPKRRQTAAGLRPVLSSRVTELDPVIDHGDPDATELLPVSGLRGFQVPGTRHSRLEWTDLNAPQAASYFIRETTGGLSTTVTTQFRESGDLAVGDYVYTVTPVSVTGASGPSVSVPVTIVPATAAPTITSTAPTVGPQTWSATHTPTQAVTATGALRRVVDGPIVASYTATAAAGVAFTESYTGLEPGTQYIRTITFTRTDNGATAVQSGAFTTQQATATLKYERLGPPLANDTDPIPAGWTDWVKVRALSPTTYTVNDGPTQGYTNGNITLPSNMSAVVLLPRAATVGRNQGGFNVINGINVAARSGEVLRDDLWTDAQYYETDNVRRNQSARKGMQLLNFTGHADCEGLLIHGHQILDCLWLNTNANIYATGPTKRYMTFQNCLFTESHHPTLDSQTGAGTWADNELHADDVMIIGGEPAQPDGTTINGRTVVRTYQCMFEGALQGIIGSTYGYGIELEMERTHFNMTEFNSDGSRDPKYPIFWGGGTVRIGPEVSVRHAITGFTQPGYPHTPVWDPVDFSHGERVDPAWKAAAWVGDKVPGRGYVAN